MNLLSLCMHGSLKCKQFLQVLKLYGNATKDTHFFPYFSLLKPIIGVCEIDSG